VPETAIAGIIKGARRRGTAFPRRGGRGRGDTMTKEIIVSSDDQVLELFVEFIDSKGLTEAKRLINEALRDSERLSLQEVKAKCESSKVPFVIEGNQFRDLKERSIRSTRLFFGKAFRICLQYPN
jgi:hypothetical protein